MKQQFNVSMPPELVRRIKHHAIDTQQSVSDLVAGALAAHLEQQEEPAVPAPDPVRVQPMVHVTDMAAAVAFHEALGAELVNGSRDGDFVLLRYGATELSLLAHPPNPDQDEGQVELNFEADDLEAVQRRVQAVGVEVVQPVTDEGFGRQLQLRTPDGLLVKVNELDQTLYG